MEAVHSSKPPRRWSKRSVVLVVSGLIAGVLLLVLGLVGFARTIGFVLGTVEGVGDVGQIAPRRAAAAGNGVTARSAAATFGESAPPTSGSSGSGASASAIPVAVASPASTSPAAGGSAGAAGTREAEVTSLDVAGVSGAEPGGGGSGAEAGGGATGAPPTFWESLLQSALALVRQTTVTMCGPNTCNTGDVCCNASCGICTAPGATCDKAPCSGAPRTPSAVRCGSTQCNDGLVCCNASCGICAAPGETCSDQKCE